ncbi:Meiotic nuclear division protein 1 [Blyttiomyces sp. JEL0837]|nr:Meiotic nuclear division protein 1 [Blyttiomyces sp. JEL0837]
MDEKKRKILEIFRETDIEKIATKQKGVISQSVEECLAALVDDHLIEKEKIGTSNYYWSFPGAALVATKKKKQDLEEEVKKAMARKADLAAKIEEARVGREMTEERKELLNKFNEAKKQNAEIKKELALYRDCDPTALEAKKKAAAVAKAAANRWTENIFCLQSYCSKNFSMDTAQFNQQFGIPENLDTIL